MIADTIPDGLDVSSLLEEAQTQQVLIIRLRSYRGAYISLCPRQRLCSQEPAALGHKVAIVCRIQAATQNFELMRRFIDSPESRFDVQ